MQSITLATINARYIHASLGLRYLLANMGKLRSATRLQEFTLEQRAEDIVEDLLCEQPRIIGFGVYIWNIQETTEVIRLLKTIQPEITIVIGGPEVSFEIGEQAIASLADHLITGQADIAFGELCQTLLEPGAGAGQPSPGKIISPLPLSLDTLASPYPCYTDADLAHRVVYVEASRGCPFKCEFCLSSLDKTAVPFALDPLLAELQTLINRGARQFKFVDRTFNLKAATGQRILQFFLQQTEKKLFLHFELVPDRLPDALKTLLPQFPAGALQFEVGIQSFNPQVQTRISRRQDHEKTLANLRWLRQHTQAHIHADLIAGLPGEDLASFVRGFDLLHSLGPQEIQVGILKRLRGTPIARHTEQYDMRYMPTPPYRILSTQGISFADMQRLVRFARYWDLLGNSGRFPATLPLLLESAPFDRFMAFSDWLFAETRQTHRIALAKLFSLLWQGLLDLQMVGADQLHCALESDFAHNKLKGRLKLGGVETQAAALNSKRAARQQRHLSQPG